MNEFYIFFVVLN